MSRKTKRSALSISAAALALTLTACSSGNGTSGSSTSSATKATTKATTASEVKLELKDGWAKAADKGMTAAFGTLQNPTSKPVTITKVSSGLGMTQLHVMTKTANGPVMKETDKFVIPAKGSLTLKPGSNHIMFMGLTKKLSAGDTVEVTLTGTDGFAQKVSFPVRAYTGANETYQGKDGSTSHSSEHSGMSDMPSMSSSASH